MILNLESRDTRQHLLQKYFILKQKKQTHLNAITSSLNLNLNLISQIIESQVL